VYKANKNF